MFVTRPDLNCQKKLIIFISKITLKKITTLDKQVSFNQIQNSDAKYTADEGFGFCGHFLIALSYFLLVVGLPFTLCCCMKVNI
jgi:hypothetical protein